MLQQREQKRILITGPLTCSLSVGDGKLGPYMGWVQGLGQRVAWVVCPLLGGGVCRGHVQGPAFAPDTSEVAVGFWVFEYLVHNLSHPHMHMVTSSPFLFPCICCWKRCLSRCRHCSKGSQVPAHHRTFCCALGLFRSGWPDTHTNHHSLGGLSGIQPSDLFVEPPASPLGSVLDCVFWGGWGLGFL